MIQTNARNANLSDLRDMLMKRQDLKHDVVVPAGSVRSRDGIFHVKGADQQLTLDGVTTVDGRFRPTEVADEGWASRLNIPTAYLKRLRSEAPDLYDANVNGWLHGRAKMVDGERVVAREADNRRFLLRTFRNLDGGEGILRSVASDRYQVIDDLDALMATLAGVKQAGTKVNIDRADLTDRYMYVRVTAPGVAALAPELLKGYRSPFTDPDVERQRNHGWSLDAARRAAGNEGLSTDEPVVFAGFEIRNSEVGCGSFSIVPVITIKVCDNGLTFTREAFRKVHLGAKLDAGVIRVSDETRRKNLDLITSQTADAVSTFLNVDYVQAKVAELERQAGVAVANPQAAIQTVGKSLAFTEAEVEGIFDHFIRGGVVTAGGVMQAITSYSQTVPNADRARHLDDSAVEAMSRLVRA